MTGEEVKTILLVEDEVLIAHMEKAMLEKYGYQVITEYKGEKAVERVDANPGIDLILMDINLGAGMTGAEAAGLILEKHDIPLIFLSSHSEPEIVAEAEKITSYGYIIKNSEETVLITSIRMAFRLFESRLREKERNEQLRESERALAEAHHMARLGHWKFELSTSSITWSDEIFNIFEIRKSDFNGDVDSFVSMIHPEDQSRMVSVNRAAAENGEGFEVGYRIVTGDKRIKYVQQKGYTRLDESGNVKVIYGTVQDITDLKLVYDAYRESELRWKSLVENSPDFIGIFDKEGRVLFLNRYAKGFSDQDVIGVSGYLFIPPEAREEWRMHFEECLENKTTRVFRNTGYGANKTIRIYENYFIYLSDRYSGPGVMGITKDVTEQTELQESLNREVREKELLLKEVHHRIKNNFASVESILQMQAESLNEGSTCRNILKSATGRVESMRMIYEKLLTTSDYTTLSTKRYMEDLVGKIRSLYTDLTGIRFEIMIEDFLLNSRQIFSLGIITNELISNIMKYAFREEKQGVVAVTLNRSGDMVTLMIRDNGTGFPEGFDPDQSHGLGMMFIHILTKQLGGTCLFENDQGACCRVDFEI